MKPDLPIGKSRVYVSEEDRVRWRQGSGQVQIFIPHEPHSTAELWCDWVQRTKCGLDVEHDDMEDVHVGSCLTVFGNTMIVKEMRESHPFVALSEAWAEPWTHWHNLRE